jgi:hypothetical protein
MKTTRLCPELGFENPNDPMKKFCYEDIRRVYEARAEWMEDFEEEVGDIVEHLRFYFPKYRISTNPRKDTIWIFGETGLLLGTIC